MAYKLQIVCHLISHPRERLYILKTEVCRIWNHGELIRQRQQKKELAF